MSAEEKCIEKFQDRLEAWDYIGALECLDDPVWTRWLEKNAALELTPVVITYITDEQEVKGPHMVAGCSQILVKLAGLGPPKESLIALIEHCEAFVSSLKFRNVLPAMAVVLDRLYSDLKTRRRLSLTWDWVLDTMVGHVKALGLPDVPECLSSSEERLVLDSDPEMVATLDTVHVFVEFLIPLQQQALHSAESFDCRETCKNILVRTAMTTLSKPLASLNLENHLSKKSGAQIKSRGLSIAEKLASIIVSLEPDIYKLAEFNRSRYLRKDTFSEDSEGEEKKERDDWTIGVGVLFYLVFNDLCSQDRSQTLSLMSSTPCVHNPAHVLNSLLPSVNALMVPGMLGENQQASMEGHHHLSLFKALQLVDCLIQRIPSASQDGVLLELTAHTEFLQNLLKVIIYDPVESFRKKGFSVFEKYFRMFSPESGFYRLVTVLLSIANHSGIIGYVISKAKDIVINGLNGKVNAPQFRGHDLKVLVRKFARLSNGAETDLLEVSDEIMGALNFLICVMMRDKENVSGIWDLKEHLLKEYVAPLDTGLSMSRAHYHASIAEDPAKGIEGEDVMSLSVGGQPLPEMTPEQKKQVVHAALNTFSMMECKLIQLKDVLDSRK